MAGVVLGSMNNDVDTHLAGYFYELGVLSVDKGYCFGSMLKPLILGNSHLSFPQPKEGPNKLRITPD